MEKTSNRSPLLALLIGLMGLLFLGGCSQEKLFPDEEKPSPTIQSLEEDPVNSAPGSIDAPCPIQAPIGASYQILSTEAQTYDLIVHIVPGSVTGLPNHCNCKYMEFCLTVNFPATSIQQAALSSLIPNSPVTVLESDGEGSFIGYAPSEFSPAVTQPGTTQTVCLRAVSQNGVLTFTFNDPLPAGTDLQALIQSISGICIIDDIVSTDE